MGLRTSGAAEFNWSARNFESSASHFSTSKRAEKNLDAARELNKQPESIGEKKQNVASGFTTLLRGEKQGMAASYSSHLPRMEDPFEPARMVQC